jgi:hypothetical protein
VKDWHSPAKLPKEVQIVVLTAALRRAQPQLDLLEQLKREGDGQRDEA